MLVGPVVALGVLELLGGAGQLVVQALALLQPALGGAGEGAAEGEAADPRGRRGGVFGEVVAALAVGVVEVGGDLPGDAAEAPSSVGWSSRVVGADGAGPGEGLGVGPAANGEVPGAEIGMMVPGAGLRGAPGGDAGAIGPVVNPGLPMCVCSLPPAGGRNLRTSRTALSALPSVYRRTLRGRGCAVRVKDPSGRKGRALGWRTGRGVRVRRSCYRRVASLSSRV